jgi:multidrug efflux pump subunit AcrA (membrane-fusion protein)
MKLKSRDRLALVVGGRRDVSTETVAFPSEPDSRATNNQPQIGRLTALGLIVIGAFFGGLALWSANAPLSSAALANGRISVETNRKSVQHLEGGIVSKILVREGQHVDVGDVLLVLDEKQTRASVDLLKSKITSADEQIALLEDELVIIQRLHDQGLARKPRLLALQRSLADINGRRSQDQSRLKASADVLARSQIRAPVAGAVVGLKVHTTGGVIAPGSELLSIVPDGEQLVIEARVDPNDIDIVRVGLTTQVQLAPFSARLLPPIAGSVASVSADRMSDETTGEDYYLARISLDAEGPLESSGVKLMPGMPVQVSIITGARTFLDYLTAPVLMSFDRAFKED